jgi:hypothetical protein
MTNRFNHRATLDRPAADKATTLTDAQRLFADVLGECIAAECRQIRQPTEDRTSTVQSRRTTLVDPSQRTQD